MYIKGDTQGRASYSSKFQSSETPPTSLISDLLINVDVVVQINNCLETQLTIQSSVGGIKYREIPVACYQATSFAMILTQQYKLLYVDLTDISIFL